MPQKLGQHFLKNESALKKIAAALNIQKNDAIIEIGAGRGKLTLLLARNSQFLISNFQIIAVEKDLELARNLKSKIKNLEIKNVKIIEGDILKILPQITKNYKLKTINYKLVGNIPYYITGKLLRIIGELKNKPKITIFTIQQEVAERIVAKPPKNNLLAAAVQFWAEPKILFTLNQNDFSPPPKVKSAVIALKTRTQADLNAPACRQAGTDAEKYYNLIRVIFKQPRKTLFNNLRKGLSLPETEIKNALKSTKINPDCRPQNLSLDQIRKLLNLIH